MEEGKPLGLPFIRCEIKVPENLSCFGEIEEKIIIPDISFSGGNIDKGVKTETLTESELVEKNSIKIVEYSTDSMSQISNAQEIIALSENPITEEDNLYSNHFQNYGGEIYQDKVRPTRKKTPSQLAHFVCNICSKIIKGKFALKTHISIHSGERPFSCKVCNKTFARKRVLEEHEIIHTGERPFSCDICGKSFAKKCTLIKHKVVHTGDRKHSCDICNKTFTQRCGLMKHRLTHTGERPYSCDFCDKAFTVRSALKRHTVKMHPDEHNMQNE